MRQKFFLISSLLSLLFSQNASAFCDSVATKVYITMNPGNVKYITTRSKHDFIHSTNSPVSPNTLGLTISHMNVSIGNFRPKLETENGQTCVSLASLNLKMEYDDLTVYIDKKYKPSSCEYKVIKKHEDYHVAVAQQAMVFFRQDVEEQVQKSLEKIRPQIANTPDEQERVLQSQIEQIKNDLKPLIEHINKVTAQKNYQIDTPESYQKTTALCKNW